jgi:hypothetical protein
MHEGYIYPVLSGMPSCTRQSGITVTEFSNSVGTLSQGRGWLREIRSPSSESSLTALPPRLQTKFANALNSLAPPNSAQIGSALCTPMVPAWSLRPNYPRDMPEMAGT